MVAATTRGANADARAVRSRFALLEGLVGWAFLLVLAVSPVIFGANVPLAWAVNAVLVGLLIVWLVVQRALTHRSFAVARRRIDMPFVCLLLVAGWIALQAVPWTPAALHHPGWPQAAAILGTSLDGAVSANPDETWLGLLRFLTALGCGWLALQIGRDRLWARRILASVAIAGAIHALYAISEQAMASRSILWYARPYWQIASGTFINANHFAAYMALGILAAMGLLLRDVGRNVILPP